MNERRLLKTGVIGSVVAAICCFTPLLVVLLGAVGLSAWLGWIDYVLFPTLAVFLGITGYALYRLNTRAKACGPANRESTVEEER